MSAADRTLRRPADLADAGLISAEQAREIEPVSERYALALPPALAGLIDSSDPADPIARQFVPDRRELAHAPEELTDPIGDDAHS
ncbi:MAG: lysine 2,3-aminomutase, partial [Methylobacteriaceae bacterium]|nr:lysine 2,3-aminomutase [Methylobacteriaceae bacterium]